MDRQGGQHIGMQQQAAQQRQIRGFDGGHQQRLPLAPEEIVELVAQRRGCP